MMTNDISYLADLAKDRNRIQHYGVKGMKWKHHKVKGGEGEYGYYIDSKGNVKIEDNYGITSDKATKEDITDRKNIPRYEDITKPEGTKSVKPKPSRKYTGNSVNVVDALRSVGMNSDFNYRKELAELNGIKDFVGTKEQNLQLLSLLRRGDIIEPTKKRTRELESKYKKAANSKVSEIKHSGIKGMKWGRRQYQNKDGSLTPAGRQRYLKNPEAHRGLGFRTIAKIKANKIKNKRTKGLKKAREAKAEKKTEKERVMEKARNNPSSLTAKDMSVFTDKELDAMNRRMQAEQTYKNYLKNYPEAIANANKARARNEIKSAVRDVLIGSAKDLSRSALTYYGKTMLGIPTDSSKKKKNK